MPEAPGRLEIRNKEGHPENFSGLLRHANISKRNGKNTTSSTHMDQRLCMEKRLETNVETEEESRVMPENRVTGAR